MTTTAAQPTSLNAQRSTLGARYAARLAERGVAPAELTANAAANPLITVAYGGRFLPAPVFLAPVERRGLAAALGTVHTMLTDLPERLFGGDVLALASAVGMTGTQASIVARAHASAQPLLPLARSDVYRCAEGFQLLELNITSALGGFENAELNRAMLNHPVLAEFVAEHGLEFVDTFAAIVATLRAECAAYLTPGRRPVVALTDWPDSFRSYEPRLRVMATLLDRMGIEALPCHVGQVEERGGRLWVHDREIDVVYRFFLIEEIVGETEAELVEPILRTVDAGRVGMFSRLDAELYGNKGTLALLSDDRHRGVFTERERDCVDRFLPWTRHVRRTATDADGQEIDLLAHAVAERGDLILKPTLLHGGTGIVPGWTVDAEEWSARITAALDGPYVLQRRVRPVPEFFPADEPDRGQHLFLNWGVFRADPAVTGGDGYAGCIVRGSLDPEVGVVSMSGGAKVACSFLEPDRAWTGAAATVEPPGA